MDEQALEDDIDDSFLPEVIREGPDLPPGKTPIHLHPQADFIWDLTRLLRLDHTGIGAGPGALLQAVQLEVPDLVMDAKQMSSFLTKYVDPAISVPPEFWRKGAIAANGEMNHVKRLIENNQALDGIRQEAEQRYLAGGDDAPLVSEVASVHRTLGKNLQIQADEMARIGLAPERKAGGVQVNVGIQNTVNLRDAAGGLLRRPKPVEADFKEKKAAE